MSAALSYITQHAEEQEEIERSAYYAQSIKQSTANRQYDVQVLLSEYSDQGDQCALIMCGDNVYSLVKFSQSNQKSVTVNVLTTLTVKEMVQKIKSVFGLNNVQVANVVRVSRPSLYNHIAGKETPVSLDPYKALYDIAVLVEVKAKGPLKLGLKSILVNGKTLLGHLKEKDVDPGKIVYVAQEVSKRLSGSTRQAEITIGKQRETSHLLTKSG